MRGGGWRKLRVLWWFENDIDAWTLGSQRGAVEYAGAGLAAAEATGREGAAARR